MFSRKKKFFALSIALLCVSCLLFSGCGSNDTPERPSGSQTDNQTAADRPENSNDISGNNMGPGFIELCLPALPQPEGDPSAEPAHPAHGSHPQEPALQQRAE